MTTTTNPAGETIEITAGPAWTFASFYTNPGQDGYLTKYHRNEAAARKGSWDSAAMKKVWHYAGYAPIER